MKNLKALLIITLVLLFILIFINSVFADLYIVKDQEGKIIAIADQSMLDKIEYQKLGYTSELWFKQTEKTFITLDSLVENWESQMKESKAILKTETEKPRSEANSDRDKMIETFKKEALVKWGKNYEMVNYTVQNQTQAYDWVVNQTKYPDIMARAKRKWQNDYEMVKYRYENQVEAYEWSVSQTAYPDIMARAKQKWGGDYEMVKYEYENQVEAYKALKD